MSQRISGKSRGSQLGLFRPSLSIRFATWTGRAIKVLVLCVILLYATEREAHAYTDPGSGAMIWQTLVAALIGAGFYFRKFLFWFKDRKNAKKIDP